MRSVVHTGLVHSSLMRTSLVWKDLTSMTTRASITNRIERPFPVVCESNVVAGFGRGSAELGIPTANVPIDGSLDKLPTGVYFGWCKVSTASESDLDKSTASSTRDVEFNYGSKLTLNDKNVLPMVMSLGWNPFYNNERKAAEVHILHNFPENFYGAHIKFIVLGYIRPELDYTTKGTHTNLALTALKTTNTIQRLS